MRAETLLLTKGTCGADLLCLVEKCACVYHFGKILEI